MTFVVISLFFIIAGILFASVYNLLVKARAEIRVTWEKASVIIEEKCVIVVKYIDVARSCIGDSEDNQLLVKIANARIGTVNAKTKNEKVEALGIVDGAMSKFNNIIDKYASLKSNEQFAEIQSEMITVNEKLLRKLKTYNNEVIYYNDKFDLPHYKYLSRIFKFEKEEQLNLTDRELAYLTE